MARNNNDPVSDETASGVPQSSLDRPERVVPWGDIPWWAVIVLIVGVLISYSMLTNVKYMDALTFILDMPWHKAELQSEPIGEGGEWILTSKAALKPGRYTFYVEIMDGDENVVARTEDYHIKVSSSALDEESEPITESGQEYLVIDANWPTLKGRSEVGEEAILYNDFSKKPLRILRNMWNSKGLFLTLRVTVMSFCIALVFGLLFGLMRVADRSPDLGENILLRLLVGIVLVLISWVLGFLPNDLWKIALLVFTVEGIMVLLPAVPYTLSTLYVEVMRGLPMLVIVLYMGFAVTPALRDASGEWMTGEIDLRGIPAAIIGLSIGYGAYLAEIFRGGIESIPKGQMEAARSLGMNYFQAMRYVILPQAIRVILPPLGNNFIALLKDSSLISVIALPELLQRGRLWISRTFRAFEGYNSVAILYLIMTLVLSLLVRVIERRSSID